MSPGQGLKRKRPSLQVSKPHNPQQDFDEACRQLQLKFRHHKTIQALAVRFLQERHQHAQAGELVVLSSIDDTVPFLEAFGPALFPSNREYRDHLLDVESPPGQLGNSWKFWARRGSARGPVFAVDSRLTQTGRANWKRTHTEPEPGREEEVRHSRLGQVISRLLQAVLEFRRNNVVASEPRSTSDLLEAIIGRAGDDTLPVLARNKTPDMPSSRDSSPEAPLIDVLRRRPQIVLPQAVLPKKRKHIEQAAASDTRVFERVPALSEISPGTTQGSSVSLRASGSGTHPATDSVAHTSSAFSLVDEIFGTLTSGTGAAQAEASLSEVISAQSLPDPPAFLPIGVAPGQKQHAPQRGTFAPSPQGQHLSRRTLQRDLVQQLQATANVRPGQGTVRRCVPPVDTRASEAQPPRISPLPCHNAVDIATSSFVVHNTQQNIPQVIATLPEVQVLSPAAWKLPTRENTRKTPGSGQWTEEDRDKVLALRAATGWMGGLPFVSRKPSVTGPVYQGSA